jgi:hypothetical protein
MDGMCWKYSDCVTQAVSKRTSNERAFVDYSILYGNNGKVFYADGRGER